MIGTRLGLAVSLPPVRPWWSISSELSGTLFRLSEKQKILREVPWKHEAAPYGAM